jgi:copper oxidase (laccase) domain-containing protein
VCGACYEVPDRLRAEVSALVPESYAETSWGTPALDIGAGVRAQLLAAGCAVVDASRCTLEDEDLFSYRRQGRLSGRLAGLVRVCR